MTRPLAAAGALAFVVAVSITAAAAAGGARPHSTHAEWVGLLHRYARGERAEAIRALGEWTLPALARQVAAVEEAARATEHCRLCPSLLDGLPLRAAVMLHWDRDLAERPAPPPGEVEQGRRCPGPTAALAERLARVLSRDDATGWTAVFDALYSGMLLTGGTPRPLVVLFTDGEDNASWLGAGDLKVVAERSDVVVQVVAWQPAPAPGAPPRVPRLAESPQDRALREIAEASGGHFRTAGSPVRLRQVFAAIADALGHRYVLRCEPSGVPGQGWHRIEARLRGVKGDVHVRSGYWVARE